ELGRNGHGITSAIKYLIAQADSSGYIGGEHASIPGHALATLALAQAYGTEIDDSLRKPLRAAADKALRLLLAAQDAPKEKEAHAGGWRASPDSPDADLPCTAICAAALAACRDVGLAAPRERFERAGAFVLRCFNPM